MSAVHASGDESEGSDCEGSALPRQRYTGSDLEFYDKLVPYVKKY